jgi:hypothetical protein
MGPHTLNPRASAPALHLAVVGVARNCARSLSRDVNRLAAAVGHMGSVRFLIVESDSTDATVQTLNALKDTRSDFDFISLGNLRPQHPQRTDRIALCRNTYLKALATDPRLAAVTHVLVADMDGVCRDLSAAGFASCFALTVPWDACFANQGDYYYDIWALRHPVWCPGDAWQQHAALLPLLGETEANNVALFSRMVHIPPHAAAIEVQSAFGGLGLYRKEALLTARYEGLDSAGQEVCEHVSLHAAMRTAGARLFINPALISARSTKHAGRKKFFRTLRRRLWNGLRGKGWY